MSELGDFLRDAAQLRQPRSLRPQDEEAAPSPPPARQPLGRSQGRTDRRPGDGGRPQGGERAAAAAAAASLAAALSADSPLEAQRLAAGIEQADERLAERLKRTFDHQVGSLAHVDELMALEDASPARQIAALLARPQSARQAVILGELLRSPVERWERSW